MSKVFGWMLVALVAFDFSFLVAGQIRAQLIPASNRLAQNQALVASVQGLEQVNSNRHAQIATLRTEINQLETRAAVRSQATQSLTAQTDRLSEEAGLTKLRGPGVVVSLDNGHPLAGETTRTGYQIDYVDLQDIVNLLFAGGADAIAVNGRRISPASYFGGVTGAIEVDQGPPLIGPYSVAAVGDRDQMASLLGQPSSLGDLKGRQRLFGLKLSWAGQPDIELNPFDGSLQPQYATPAG
ncbi:MAG TPA: DUF881 domain-containing protein [Candidatus Dormibacteraeota bacterium]|jgi:uncharacterized protein YlxW (UPF0749 family)|nr:DUF881 domain-containing protein [Candidatus Dormibacteraeota bacterium]